MAESLTELLLKSISLVRLETGNSVMRVATAILLSSVICFGAAEAAPRKDSAEPQKAVASGSAWLASLDSFEEGRVAWPYFSKAPLVSGADYPEAARREGKQGSSRISITVGPDGKAIGCTVTESAGDVRLDAAACDAVRARARFRHALDGNGIPVAGSVGFLIEWVLSEPGIVPSPPPVSYPPPPTSPERRDWPRTGWMESVFPQPGMPKSIAVPKAMKPAAGETGLDVKVSEDGNVDSCKPTKGSGNEALDALACSAVAAFRFRIERKCANDAHCGLRTPLLVRWKGKSGLILFPLTGRNFQTAKPAKLYTPSIKDYPVSALQAGQQGIVRVSLKIDASGIPVKCLINNSSDYDLLDQRTCEIAKKHIRYVPFTDVFGNPIAGRAFFSLNWKL